LQYLLLFLEGIITFISPCLLPMLPIYISFFAGQTGNGKKHTAVINASGFVLGFTIIFVTLGAFAGLIGNFLKEYSTLVNTISGIVVIIFGLNFMEIIRIPFINANRRINIKTSKLGFFTAMLFGIIFSIGWTPCVGAFLGSALALAATSGNTFQAITMLLFYSIGLGIPFIISAFLINQLKSSFDFIKKHYRIINLVSGGLLVIVGILMITGKMGYFLSLLTF